MWLVHAINAALVSTGCFGWLGWLRCIRFQFKASHWKSDWAGWTHHGSINMRLDGRLVVGVFFGSALEKSPPLTDLSTTDSLLDSTRICQGADLGKGKLHFNFANSIQGQHRRCNHYAEDKPAWMNCSHCKNEITVNILIYRCNFNVF